MKTILAFALLAAVALFMAGCSCGKCCSKGEKASSPKECHHHHKIHAQGNNAHQAQAPAEDMVLIVGEEVETDCACPSANACGKKADKPCPMTNAKPSPMMAPKTMTPAPATPAAN